MKKFFGFITFCFIIMSSFLVTGCDTCDHYWLTYDIVKLRTCNEGGRVKEVCDNCGAKREIDVSSYGGHKWDKDNAKIIERGDCRTPEKVEYTCENYGCVEKEYEYRTIPHSYEKYVTDVEATCTTDGKSHMACYWCNQPEKDENGNIVYNVEEAHGHDYRLGKCLFCEDEGVFNVTIKTSYPRFDIDLSEVPETFSLSDGVIPLPQLSYPHLIFQGFYHTNASTRLCMIKTLQNQMWTA